MNIYQLTNKYRAEQGLAPLTYDYRLEQSAKVKAVDICDNNYWSHDRPDGTPWHKNIYNHYPGKAVGENLAKNFTSDASTMQAWIDSPTHRANIVESWEHIGVYTHNCNGVLISVQHFGVLKQVQTPRPVEKQPPKTTPFTGEDQTDDTETQITPEQITQARELEAKTEPEPTVAHSEYIISVLIIVFVLVLGFIHIYNYVKNRVR